MRHLLASDVLDILPEGITHFKGQEREVTSDILNVSPEGKKQDETLCAI
jgi:hypothetical protein